jgi:transcriptional regulator with XRE-family HTH domain
VTSRKPTGLVSDLADPVTQRVSDLGAYLREQRHHAQLSLRQLAEVAGVSNPYLSQVERGLRRPSAEVLQQIARGLKISAEALYVRAGILEESHEDQDVIRALRQDHHLRERHRSILIELYQTFRAESSTTTDLEKGTTS